MTSIRLTLPFPPSANRLWRRAKGRTIKSKEARGYSGAVRLAARTQLPAFRPFEGPVRVALRFFRPRATGDLDNRIKAVLDALQDQVVKAGRVKTKSPGVAFRNDSQVRSLTADLLEARTAAGARVEVEIEEMVDRLLFDDIEDRLKSESPRMRERLKSWCETEFSRPPRRRPVSISADRVAMAGATIANAVKDSERDEEFLYRNGLNMGSLPTPNVVKARPTDER